MNRLFLGLVILVLTTLTGLEASASPAFPTPAEMEAWKAQALPAVSRAEARYQNSVAPGALEMAIRLVAFYDPLTEQRIPARAVQVIKWTLQAKGTVKSVEAMRLDEQVQMLEIHVDSVRTNVSRRPPTDPANAVDRRTLENLGAQLQAFRVERAGVERRDLIAAKQTEISKLLRERAPGATRDQSTLEQKMTELKELGGTPRFDGDVTAEDVARWYAERQGLAYAVAVETMDEKLARVEAELRASVHGNDHVIEAVVRRLRRRASGEDPDRGPIRILLEGEPGTGRTHFEKILARAWYGKANDVDSNLVMNTGPIYSSGVRDVYVSPARLVRLDNFSGADSGAFKEVAALFGIATGDNAEDLATNFDNTIVTATTDFTAAWPTLRGHYPPEDLETAFGLPAESLEGKGGAEQDRTMITTMAARRNFPPKFLNAFSEILTFNSISPTAAVGIVEQTQAKIVAHLLDTRRVTLEVDPAVAVGLVKLNYDPSHSGRHYEIITQDLLADGALTFLRTRRELPPYLELKVTFAMGTDAGIFTFHSSFFDGTTEQHDVRVVQQPSRHPFLHSGIHREPEIVAPGDCAHLFW